MPVTHTVVAIVAGGMATTGLLAGCSSTPDPVPAVSPSSAANSVDIPSFSEFLDCIPEDSFADVELALNTYEDGTAARVDVAESMASLAVSFGLAAMEPLEGETPILTPEALAAYAGTETDLRKARAQFLDNPDYTVEQAAAAVQRAREVRSEHQPQECAEIRGNPQ